MSNFGLRKKPRKSDSLTHDVKMRQTAQFLDEEQSHYFISKQEKM